MRNLANFLKKHYPALILGAAVLIFAWVYLFLYRGLGAPETLIFNQPDEMANYAFIKEWALNNQVGIEEPLSELSFNQIHPRSMTVVQGTLVPIGFPGFIAIMTSLIQPFTWLFGAEHFNDLVVLVTPVLAALSSILLYGISRSLGLTRAQSVTSGLFLLALPPWWYYASRPLQANTIFVFFILAALWAGLRRNEKLSRFFLVGLSVGLALYIRPSEWVWVFGLVGLLGYYNREFLRTKTVIIFALSSGLMAIVFFLTQFAFYGSVFGSGYVRPNSDGSAGLIIAGPQGIYWVKALLLPFGFNALTILKTIFFYGVKLFLPWTIATVIGFGLVFFNKKTAPVLFKYSLAVLALGMWLALYYGPWQFADNLAGEASIGSSQVRYFLPLYVLAVPLVAYLLGVLSSWKIFGKVSAGLITIALMVFSVKAVYFKFEGLLHVKETVTKYYMWQEKILTLTPETAIVVTRYGDKYLYPVRPVIATIDTPEGQAAVKQLLARGADVYWYDLAMEKPGHITDPAAFSLQTQGVELGKPIATWENLELRELYLP